MAEQVLIKSGGVIDSNGNAILDLKTLSNDQKRVMGELFGENTVKQIVPDGEKLARMQGTGSKGIDDLYKVNKPDVDYVVIEYKFVGTDAKTGASALDRTTLDGPQGSQSWTMGSDRIPQAVGREVAADVELAVKNGRTETWVVTTRADGATEVQVLDTLGKPKPIDTSRIILPKVNLSGAKP
jgi:filamentous hemagglutinin